MVEKCGIWGLLIQAVARDVSSARLIREKSACLQMSGAKAEIYLC